MASTPFLFCGPCETRKAHRQAMVWCSVCMEGLCKECAELHQSSKLSKDHSTFNEDIYPLLRPFLNDLTTECYDHKKKFDFFCQSHSTLCCVNCVTDTHRQCDVKPVDDESQSPRASIASSKMEDDLVGVLERIEKIKCHRTDNIKFLNEQKDVLQSEIKNVRKALNEHLDKLEKAILDELIVGEQKHSLDIAQFLFDIDTKKQQLVDIQTISGCIKKIGSGVQTFLASNKLEKMFSKEKRLIEATLKENEGENLQLYLHLNPRIISLTNDIKSFGSIDTQEKPPPSAIPESITRAENRNSTKSIASRVIETTDPNRVMLKVIKKIKTCKRKSRIPIDLRGCVILADEKLLFADWSDNKKLIMFNIDGTHNRDIGVTGKPYDITRLDGDRIAVSFPEDNIVQIFDVVSNGYPIYQNIKMTDQCWAIFYNDEKLFVGCNGHKIQVMNLSGRILQTVPAKVNTVYCVNANNDCVYYSDEINNTVYCCDLEGNELWKFRDPSLKYPCALAYNREGYVFVVGNLSQNILVTSSDGQQSKSLLSKLDGVDGPAGIYFDQRSSRLLVVSASFKGVVALYDVITKPKFSNVYSS
ncbi:transcription intermediary factor 1-alpha-like [Mytilus trossulus]|uniref:transcription intermediary factor 1-alpha-like n=1 Tax=Mytilus trossulus TaxID=6551 RepID=UPI003007425B